MGEIRITVDGKHALTTRQLGAEFGLDAATTRSAIRRVGLEPVDHLDERTPLYAATPARKAMRERPGKGAPGRARPSNCDECGHRKAGHSPVLISSEPVELYALGRCGIKGCNCGVEASG